MRNLSKIVLVLLLVTISANAAALIYYSQQYFTTYKKISRYVHVNNVINLLLVAQHTSPDKLAKRLKTAGHSNTIITYSTQPKFNLQIKAVPIAEIETKLKAYHTQTRLIQVSYQYSPQFWINISIDKQKLSFSKYLTLPILLLIMLLVAQVIILFIALSYYMTTQYLLRKRIKQLITERVATLAGLSHDLKTPLTRLKLLTELQQDNEQKQQLLNEIDQMQYLLKQSLQFVNANYSDEPSNTIDLVSLLETICVEMQDMGYSIQFNTAVAACNLLTQEQNLRRAFTNLINNAVQYASTVTVNITLEAGKLIIDIVDDGPGIPEHDLDRVLAPFFRGSNANLQGSGLGLSIANTAITDNGGTITLTNCKPHGLHARVWFSTNSKSSCLRNWFSQAAL